MSAAKTAKTTIPGHKIFKRVRRELIDIFEKIMVYFPVEIL